MYGDYSNIHLPCGAVAEFDTGSMCAHRCTHCFAVVGSIAQPQQCKDEAMKWDALELAGMFKWDYNKGEPVTCNMEEKA